MTTEIEEIGGIRASKRGIPAWLNLIAIAILSLAAWYLLSFSSTPHTGTFPRPEPPAVQIPGGEPAKAH